MEGLMAATAVRTQEEFVERLGRRGSTWCFALQRGHSAVEVLRPVSLPGMRILMGVLFVWFGGLKVAGKSPVSDLVAGTLPWAAPHIVVPTLGVVEVVLGLGLVTGLVLRAVLPVLAAHLAGTFLTFVMLPAMMFQHHNVLLLSADGEFVAKNLVLISATIVLITHTAGPGRTEVTLRGLPVPRPDGTPS